MKKNFYLKRTTGIYCFTHIATGRQYVGQSVDCAERFKQHTTPKKGAAGIKGAIMKWGVDAFSFQILEECKREELNEREVYWIAELGTLSPGGYNLTSGGGQGTVISDETKAKLSAAGKGRTTSPETKAKISASGKGKNTGKVASDETKEKLRAKSTGRTHSPEAIEKCSAAKRGNIISDETKEKIRAANLGKTASPETRAKMTATRKGKLLSSEHRERISAGHLRRAKAARAATVEAASYTEPLLEALSALKTDATWITMDCDNTPLAGPQTVAPPTLAELEEILSWL